MPAHKPLLTVFLASKGAPPVLATGKRGRLPSYSFPENAARALAAAVRYGRWRERPRGQAIHLDDEKRARVRQIVEDSLRAQPQPHWLEHDGVEALLGAAGIEMARSRACLPEEAPGVAEQLGYPLVAKAIAPGLVHKSDVGGVVLDLESAGDVRQAVVTLQGADGRRRHEADQAPAAAPGQGRPGGPGRRRGRPDLRPAARLWRGRCAGRAAARRVVPPAPGHGSRRRGDDRSPALAAAVRRLPRCSAGRSWGLGRPPPAPIGPGRGCSGAA